MRMCVSIGFGITLALAGPLQPAKADDVSNGKELFAICAACHGPEGGGNQAALAPSIAGLDEWYIVQQLDDFRFGRRGFHFEDTGGQLMAPMARAVGTEDNVRAIAAYVASLPPVKPPRTVKAGDPDRGANRYAACVACHGFGGNGNQVINAPAINHASDWYLLKQLGNFRAGRRGTKPGDRSGQLMRGMAMTLPDQGAVEDVVAYITRTLTPPRCASATP